MNAKCPYCGHENIAGSDRCGKCHTSFTQKDVPHSPKDKFRVKLMTEKVSDFISKTPPIIVRPETPISEVVAKMQSLPQKGCVLICNEKTELLGIVSIRDILLRVAGVVDLEKTRVSAIMTPKPETLPRDAHLSYALHMMSIGKFRHVPVVAEDGKTPVGVVSTRDVIEYLASKKKP